MDAAPLTVAQIAEDLEREGVRAISETAGHAFVPAKSGTWEIYNVDWETVLIVYFDAEGNQDPARRYQSTKAGAVYLVKALVRGEDAK